MQIFTDTNLVIYLLLLAAIACGWLLGRFQGRRSATLRMSRDTLPSIDFLLAESNDRALDRLLDVEEVSDEAVELYLEAQAQLANDDLDVARQSLSKLAERVNEATPEGSRKALHAWQQVASKLVGHARHGASSSDAGDLRNAFEHLSAQLSELLRLFGNPLDTALQLAFCPMAFDSNGAEWVQRDGALQNPYYGQAMLRCGEFRATVLPSERLGASIEPDTPPPASAGGHQH